MAKKKELKTKLPIQNASVFKQKKISQSFNFSNKHYYLLIILGVLLVYTKSMFFDYVDLDDHGTIVENKIFFANINNFLHGFKETYWVSFYRPLLWGSFVLEFQLSNINPFLYHFDNIIFHSLTCILIFNLLIRLNINNKIAFGLSLLFALHPLCSQAVAWMYGRNDSLLAIVVLGSFISFMKYLQTNQNKYLFLHLFIFLIALFTKESAIVIPFLCFFFYFTFRQCSFKNKKFIHWLLLSFSWFILTLLWFFIRKTAMDNKVLQEIGIIALQKKSEIVGLQAFIKNIPFLFESLYKLILPFNISVYPTYSTIAVIIGALFYLVLLIIIIIHKKLINIFLFAMSWWFMFLIPPMLLYFTDGRYDYLEHRVYVPAIGIIIFLAFLLNKTKNLGKLKWYLGIIIFIFAIKTFIYIDNFKNKENYWLSAMESSPKKINPAKVLSMYYDKTEQYEKSYQMFQQQYKIDSNDITVLNYLSVYYIKNKNFESANNIFKRGFALNIKNYELNNNYANFMKDQKLDDSAIKYFNLAINIDSTHWEPKYFMAFIYNERNDFKLAEKYFRQVLTINKNETNSLIRLGVILGNYKQYNDAEILWKKTNEIDKKLIDPYNYLVKLYIFQNRNLEAQALLDTAKLYNVQTDFKTFLIPQQQLLQSK